MHVFNTILIIPLALSSSTLAHLALKSPPQFMVSWNPTATQIDDNNLDPLFPDGRNYPCMNGHLGMTGASSVATWPAGSTQSMSLEGSAVHNGGSCQISLSYDKGKTFRVIHSYIGSCPLLGQSYSFKIPPDAPTGLAIFSWSWINHTGNREFYHKCTAVTITKGSGKASVAFAKRPTMFIANMDSTSCTSIEEQDPVYPNPGPDVTRKVSGQSGSGLTGDCGKNVVMPISASSASSGVSDNITALDDGNIATGLAPGKITALPVSSDGSCGAAAGRSCIPGSCCSQYNYCGFFDGHCKQGCQPEYGQCGSSSGGVIIGGGGVAGGAGIAGGGGDQSSGRQSISRPFALGGSLKQIFLGVVPGRVRVQ